MQPAGALETDCTAHDGRTDGRALGTDGAALRSDPGRGEDKTGRHGEREDRGGEGGLSLFATNADCLLATSIGGASGGGGVTGVQVRRWCPHSARLRATTTTSALARPKPQSRTHTHSRFV